ncbi:hypothetical protein CR513_10436, partial [Mucuna pruriens]
MSRMGIKFEDVILGLLLLNSIPESWETFKGSVLNDEMRRKAQGSSSQFEGDKSKKERNKSRNPSPYTRIWSKHCFLWKKENKGKKGKSKEKDDDRVTIATSDDLVILRDFESVNFVSDESMWIIDSGATLHVTSRKEFFTSYIVGDFGVLKMGNDSVTKEIGVKHALHVRFNLISVHMLDDVGYDNHFGHGKWKLTKALVAKDSVNAIDMEASLCHQRLSHISENGLNCLAKKNMLPGLKNTKLEKCSHCMVGKQTKVFFKKHPPLRKSKLLELVHSYVCCPLKVKSFSGALCFVTFIDDCSKKLWVYVLKTKDQVLERFKQFQDLVERQLISGIANLRSILSRTRSRLSTDSGTIEFD